MHLFCALQCSRIRRRHRLCADNVYCTLQSGRMRPCVSARKAVTRKTGARKASTRKAGTRKASTRKVGAWEAGTRNKGGVLCMLCMLRSISQEVEVRWERLETCRQAAVTQEVVDLNGCLSAMEVRCT